MLPWNLFIQQYRLAIMLVIQTCFILYLPSRSVKRQHRWVLIVQIWYHSGLISKTNLLIQIGRADVMLSVCWVVDGCIMETGLNEISQKYKRELTAQNTHGFRKFTHYRCMVTLSENHVVISKKKRFIRVKNASLSQKGNDSFA